jgi:hypothetical protein
MAEEQPSLHIDTDWKKQAQEEKRKMAEQAAKTKEPAVPAASAPASGAAVAVPAGGRRRASRELPPPGIAALIQSLMTQILYYLGDLPSAGGQTIMDVDMAKHQLDTLSILEEKTKNNLTEEEKGLLDAALYETRSRFINVASQLLGP